MLWLIIVGVILLIVGLPLIVWFYLAPRNMFFTFVKEGTAKIVVRGDAVRKVLIQFKGFTLNQDWEVVKAAEGQERYLFGGLRWVGIWPLDDVYIYRFQWANVLHNDEVVWHEPEWLDYILLKEDIYYFVLQRIEDADTFHVDVEVLLTIRIVNPHKALFRVQDWLETVINRFKPLVRDKTAEVSYKELTAQRGSMSGKLFGDSEDLRKEEFSERYGVEVRAVEVKSIDPSDEEKYREETLRKWTAERRAEQIKVEAEAQADRVATEYGAVRRQGLRGLFIRWLESRYGR